MKQLNINVTTRTNGSYIAIVETKGKEYATSCGNYKPSEQEILDYWKENKKAFKPYNRAGDYYIQ